MQAFVRFTVLYCVFAVSVVYFFRDDPGEIVSDAIASVPGLLMILPRSGIWAIMLCAAAIFLVPRQGLAGRVGRALVMVVTASAFFLSFTVIKTSLPFLIPFWADPPMAEIDRVLHFGIDPWRITHALLPNWSPRWFQIYYVAIWLIPALYFPVFLVLLDNDRARIRAYLTLYVWAWVGIGTVFALIFMSAGPVFHDRLLGGTRFAPLMEVLAEKGFLASSLGAIQSLLWDNYVSGSQTLGSGISAFPSVHVALATLIALYVSERWRLAIVPMVVMVAGYQILSVHLGWHYAIDGYFSIITVVALRLWLWRRAAAPGAAAMPVAQNRGRAL
ncbi:phosphatase PAP2 family protein [Oceaniglobus indicus]|uniref:phosphatase PAP2 family protein n=1 Tax=Oceaniglobus indicus TaxID=2047749 RepID=UPI000C175713|nr:phosphatase PAP2 family protein [Oceaniglobus indicus]